MYPWLLPAVKAILPYVGDIVNAALPVFKSRKIDVGTTTKDGVTTLDGATPQEALLQKQINELQDVASLNAVHIKDLAEQLRQVVMTLEKGVIANERRYRRMWLLSSTAIVLSLIAIGLWWRVA